MVYQLINLGSQNSNFENILNSGWTQLAQKTDASSDVVALSDSPSNYRWFVFALQNTTDEIIATTIIPYAYWNSGKRFMVSFAGSSNTDAVGYKASGGIYISNASTARHVAFFGIK